MIVPFDENKVKFSRNSRYQFYTEAMWEVENHPDVLCLDKDDTAEEFLCDAYGVVRPMDSPPVPPLQERPQAQAVPEKIIIDLDEEDDIDAIADITLALDTSSDVKSDDKKGALIDNLEFSDDDSEDMAPLYSKLINITGSRDPSSSVIVADSSSAVQDEAEALIRSCIGANHRFKECTVTLTRMSDHDISKAIKANKAISVGSGQLLVSQQCVTTINKEPRVLDTIIIDSDDNQSVIVVSAPAPDSKSSSEAKVMPKSRQIQIPRWPKPLFEKCSENMRPDKLANALATKKVPNKPKDKLEKKEKHEITKKSVKETSLSFDNLFSKKFNILGSGFKIGKKATAVCESTTIVEDDDSGWTKAEVMDMEEEKVDKHEQEDMEGVVETTVKVDEEAAGDIMDEDLEAEKWCKAQDWGNDEDIGDIGDLGELNLPDDDGDDDGSNDSWTHGRKQGSPKSKVDSKKESVHGVGDEDDEEDPEFNNLVDMARNRRKVRENTSDGHSEDKIREIEMSNDANYREVMENGDDFVEGFEDDLAWRPADPGDYGDGGKWFEVDKFQYCQSPPRYSDLVESRVISSPPREVQSIKSEAWSDCRPSRGASNRGNNNHINGRASYNHQDRFPTMPGPMPGPAPRISPNYPQAPVTRDPRIAPKNYDTDRMKNDQTEIISDVWRRHIDAKKQNWEQQRTNTYGVDQSRNLTGFQSRVNDDPRRGNANNLGTTRPGPMSRTSGQPGNHGTCAGIDRQGGPQSIDGAYVSMGRQGQHPGVEGAYGGMGRHTGQSSADRSIPGADTAYGTINRPGYLDPRGAPQIRPGYPASMVANDPRGVGQIRPGVAQRMHYPPNDPWAMYQQYQYGMASPYDDPAMLYHYYPHLFHARFGVTGSMFMGNRFNVPTDTPASPDPEDMGVSQTLIPQQGYNLPPCTTYTPASPDPVIASNPQSPDDTSNNNDPNHYAPPIKEEIPFQYEDQQYPTESSSQDLIHQDHDHHESLSHQINEQYMKEKDQEMIHPDHDPHESSSHKINNPHQIMIQTDQPIIESLLKSSPNNYAEYPSQISDHQEGAEAPNEDHNSHDPIMKSSPTNVRDEPQDPSQFNDHSMEDTSGKNIDRNESEDLSQVNDPQSTDIVHGDQRSHDMLMKSIPPGARDEPQYPPQVNDHSMEGMYQRNIDRNESEDLFQVNNHQGTDILYGDQRPHEILMKTIPPGARDEPQYPPQVNDHSMEGMSGRSMERDEYSSDYPYNNNNDRGHPHNIPVTEVYKEVMISAVTQSPGGESKVEAYHPPAPLPAQHQPSPISPDPLITTSIILEPVSPPSVGPAHHDPPMADC